MNASILDLIGSFTSRNPEVATAKEEVTTATATASAPQVIREDHRGAPDTTDARAEHPPAYSVVIFSKDRPFQLYSLLKSMEKFFLDVPLNIFVIYTTCSQWRQHYDAVFSLYSTTVTPILESIFSEDVEACFDRIAADPDNSFIMLCVDDLLFYDDVSFRYSRQRSAVALVCCLSCC
jgi:hypothetical protein